MLAKINVERAKVLLDLLLWLQNGMYPFGKLKKATLPHQDENLPRTMPRGGREHALFLFFVCLWMKGPIQSDTAVRQLGKLYDDHPDFFEPGIAKDLDAEYLSAILLTYGLTMRKWNSVYWIRNSYILFEKWDSDPRNLYKGLEGKTDREIWAVLVKRIKRVKNNGFWGFQEKMVSMLTYYLMDSGLIWQFIFPSPVDFHVIRLFVILGIVEVNEEEYKSSGEYVEKLRGIIRHFLFDFSLENGVNSLRLCDAIWMFSRAMCSETPSALSNVQKKDEQGTELRGRFRKVTQKPVRWSNINTLESYQLSCGNCPWEKQCVYIVRAAPYYVHGVVKIEPRKKPPFEALFSLAEQQLETLNDAEPEAS